jgi:hypothetical protein
MNGHILLNKYSKIPGGNIGMFIALQKGEYGTNGLKGLLEQDSKKLHKKD